MGFQEYWEKWKSQIPSMSMVLAIVVLILNIIWPGLGTVVMIFIANCQNWSDMALVALLQFLLTIIIIGWVWSIIWGVFALQKAS